VGGDKMQRAMQIPQVLITAILGLIVLFVVSTDFFKRRLQTRRISEEAETFFEKETGAGEEASA